MNENNNQDDDCGNENGRKSLFGGPSKETAMASSRTTSAFTNQIACLLTVKGLKQVLVGKISNEPIEKSSVNRRLSRNHLALDVPSLAYGECALLLNLASNLCESADGSHNGILCNSFFDEVQSMMKASEVIETSKWKDKWSDLTTACSDNAKVNDALTRKATPHVAGWDTKNLMKRAHVARKVRLNKLTCGLGRELHAMTKKRVSHGAKHVDARGEGSLRWPSKIIAMLTGTMTKSFERFFNCEDCSNDCFVSCPSSRVASLTLKWVVRGMMTSSPIFNDCEVQCHSGCSNLMKCATNPLVTTCFNVSANNFTLALSRRAVAKKLTLKMVKDLKKKERCANSLRQKK